jgi:hypothetical protein
MKELYHLPDLLSRVSGPHEDITNTENITGNCTRIVGDARNLTGDVTCITGDVTGLTGDASNASLHTYERKEIYIGDITGIDNLTVSAYMAISTVEIVS